MSKEGDRPEGDQIPSQTSTPINNLENAEKEKKNEKLENNQKKESNESVQDSTQPESSAQSTIESQSDPKPYEPIDYKKFSKKYANANSNANGTPKPDTINSKSGDLNANFKKPPPKIHPTISQRYKEAQELQPIAPDQFRITDMDSNNMKMSFPDSHITEIFKFPIVNFRAANKKVAVDEF
ncbi:hypothetical protein BN7_6767 [Wickerhamomyces ciferrii]|uniref:Uncharacterized protein n=1 Tax=Wickerhamomyces ciferrii (strain ATCC 14091 / BCRC 22168 / CBS 111 / JCM 3599 / NBRC 0793 / NRRL Y-1031 F-60-10) TaxID=1206466 RepID=K0KYK1_WICCF|nr:uncharacterized protein BN7_6767 [Wickerhamomyces ciferrii]CCH47152.1 hypothetical protein BN7_6767 [Wickerhamomyces ciferrii]